MNTLKWAAVVCILSAFVTAELSGEEAKPAAVSDTKAAPVVALKVKREQSSSASTSNEFESVALKDEHGATTSKTQTKWHSRKTDEALLKLAIEVRNLGSAPAAVELMWYFIAKTADGGRLWVLDKGSKVLDLPVQGAPTKEDVESPVVTKSRTSTDGVRTGESGSTISGYIVMIKAGDKILKIAASSKSLEELGRSPAELASMPDSPDVPKRVAKDKKKP